MIWDLYNNQHPICRNTECRHQRLTIKHCLQDCPQWREERRKHNIQYNVRKTLGKDFELANVMKFLKKINSFEEI